MTPRDFQRELQAEREIIRGYESTSHYIPADVSVGSVAPAFTFAPRQRKRGFPPMLSTFLPRRKVCPSEIIILYPAIAQEREREREMMIGNAMITIDPSVDRSFVSLSPRDCTHSRGLLAVNDNTRRAS